jgi:hypothetical protein
MAPIREAYAHPPITVERKQSGEVRDCKIGDVPPVPRELGLIFGDCLHNFRAVLDNLAFTIATDNNERLTSEERRANNFPLCEKRNEFREARCKGAIAKLPVRAQATVQRLQPYKAGKEAQWEPLAILRKLSDIDKHRSIPVVAWSAQGVGQIVQEPKCKSIWLAHELAPNTKFFRLRVPRQHADMYMELYFSFAVSLQQPHELRGRDIWFWLNDIRGAILNKVLSALAPYCIGDLPADLDVLATAKTPPLYLGWTTVVT